MASEKRTVPLRGDEQGKKAGSYSLAGQYSAPKDAVQSVTGTDVEEFDPLSERQKLRGKHARESDYHRRRYNRALSPERDPNMTDEELAKLREEEQRERIDTGAEKLVEMTHADDDGQKTPPRRAGRKRRWDVGSEDNNDDNNDNKGNGTSKKSRWDSDGIQDVSNEPGDAGYTIPEENRVTFSKTNDSLITDIPGVKDLDHFKKEDEKYFGKLLDGKSQNDLSIEELKERKIMRLLLKVKNGYPADRKMALRQLTENARTFGAKSLFNQILPLLMEKSLDDDERHVLVKVIDRVLHKLGDLIRPYTHKILLVISPLLIDEDPITRREGREIISNLAKASGLAHMISTVRPDIDHADEYVRNTTSRTLAVIASALGVPSMMKFLNAVCHSKKSWQARHTGIKVIQQISILMGCGVLPHLNELVSCVRDGLTDEQLSVRTMTANTLSALAEAANPYGIESFEEILEPLWKGIRRHRGRGLAAFLRCIGNIIPLMDAEYASYYTREIMHIVLREFSSPDDEMKRAVLKVVQQCSVTEGVEPTYLRNEVIPPFFKYFWVRRVALDRRSSRDVINTSFILSEKVGVAEFIHRLTPTLKDESEPFRTMAVEAIHLIVNKYGCTGLTERSEEMLLDGLLVAYQEQTTNDKIILRGFTTIIVALDKRVKPFIGQIITVILHRLKSRQAEVREQAADSIAQIVSVIKSCGEDAILNKLSTILFELLGESEPSVLGSILGAITSIATIVGIGSMEPPANKLVPVLVPIMKNKNDKVQANLIQLIGRIADIGAEYVSPKEWMRICHDLLDTLGSEKKNIRRAANNTIGYIAKAVGPQEVLVLLLIQLRTQDRQRRLCSAVAIGIIAESCSPFTVLPALMNEYRTPEVNVQNGVLKAMTFMFEYIGDISADYMYAVAPLVEDALIDRDQVHRQTAATVVRHIALGCIGLGREDVFIHFLNLLMPNIFETSPHVIHRIMEGIEGVRNALGPGMVMNYVWNGLFHPARKVRTPYWKLYNSAYVQQLDSLVPYYPRIEEEAYNIDLLDAIL